MRKCIYRCEGEQCERQPHKLQQKASERREYTTTAMFMAHGRNYLLQQRQVKEGTMCSCSWPHRRKKYSTIAIHLPFAFLVWRAERGEGVCWGGAGWSRESSIGLNFNITQWCVLDPTRLYFPFTKPGKTEEAATEFRKGTKKSTFWIPVKEPSSE